MSEDYPWKLQEPGDHEIADFDGPSYGRRYEVYYNQVLVGEIKIQADSLHEYSTDDPNVVVDVELNYVRILPFDRVYGFLNHLTLLLSSGTKRTENVELSMLIYQALLKTLWSYGPNDPRRYDYFFDEPLELSFKSVARNFLKWSAKLIERRSRRADG